MNPWPSAYDALAEFDQWILWRPVPSAVRPGKVDKKPTNPATGKNQFGYLDPPAWMSATEAYAAAERTGHKVGFVLTREDPFAFIDLDECRDGAGWNAAANTIVAATSGALVEVSQSQRGLHIIGHHSACPDHAIDVKGFGGLYRHRRFIALGHDAYGDSGHDITEPLELIASKYFVPQVHACVPLSCGPDKGCTGPTDDDELIRRACKAKPDFDDTCPFKSLWRANEKDLCKFFGDGDGYDASAADAALIRHLAFWTCRDGERIMRLLMRDDCKLYRAKWTDRSDYLQKFTIPRILARTTRIHDRKPAELKPEVEEATGIRRRTNYQLMPPDAQIEHFEGCHYVRSVDRIITPRGELLDRSRFKATFGGYVFGLDDTATNTTRDAWEVYTQSQAIDYPQADSLCFLPARENTTLHKIDGDQVANTWVHCATESIEGDASPFVAHVQKILPEGQDAAIVMAWMSAAVQYQGKKFDWCPVVQGVPGNGKSTLGRCLRAAIGNKHVSEPSPKAIFSDSFNEWLATSILVIVNDVFIPPGESRAMDVIKPMITENYAMIRRMRCAGATERICANFFMTANRKDAIPKSENDRRFAVLFCAQQTVQDLARDGMGEGDPYFRNLNDWLDSGGFAIVSHYLAHYPIPDALDPTKGCRRAPRTSSHAEAISEGRSPATHAIAESMEAGILGCRGGWMSSIRATRALLDLRIPCGTRAVGVAAHELGMVPCPGLVRGRSRRTIKSEGGRPVLYVTPELARYLDGVIDPVQEYEVAQGYVSM